MNKFTQFLNRIFGRSTSSAPAESSASFITTAFEEMVAQHRQHASSWKHGKEKGWTADLRAGVIMFKFDKDQTGTAHFQTIGSYDEVAGTFTWAWANDSVPAALCKHAKLAKKWGLTQQHPSFTSKTVTCTMQDAWNFAAATRKIANAKTVYRGRVGSNFIFMTTDEVHLDAPGSNALWAANRNKTNW